MPRIPKNSKAKPYDALHPRYGSYMVKDKNDAGSMMSRDEIEFMLAMERYIRDHMRPYPDCRDVLAVARSLGYTKEQL